MLRLSPLTPRWLIVALSVRVIVVNHLFEMEAQCLVIFGRWGVSCWRSIASRLWKFSTTHYDMQLFDVKLSSICPTHVIRCIIKINLIFRSRECQVALGMFRRRRYMLLLTTMFHASEISIKVERNMSFVHLQILEASHFLLSKIVTQFLTAASMAEGGVTSFEQSPF